MMCQFLRETALPGRERELQHLFPEWDCLGHCQGMEDVCKELNSVHQPWPWKAEAWVITNVNLSSLHCRDAPKTRYPAHKLYLHTIHKIVTKESLKMTNLKKSDLYNTGNKNPNFWHFFFLIFVLSFIHRTCLSASTGQTVRVTQKLHTTIRDRPFFKW